MIIKGNTHAHGVKLAAYMTEGREGERAELWELRGFAADNIKDAFRDVEIMAEATKCVQPLFHVQVRNREGEALTREQWQHTADRIERMLGLTGQPRAITFHTYEHNNDQHMHVAWSRIDEEILTAKHLPFFQDRLRKLSRELELHFGLEPVTNRRESNIRFAPTRDEIDQARRLGLDAHEVRNSIRACWDRSDCGTSFQAALEDEGLTLAKGDKRDFIVIDQAGGLHPLGKRILDMSASRVRERLSDLTRDELPSVELARAFVEMPEKEKGQTKERPEHAWDRDREDRLWQEAVIQAAIEKENKERNFIDPAERALEDRQNGGGAGSREKELGLTAGEIRLAYSLTSTGPEFANALEDRGLILAQATEADAERMNRWERQRVKEERESAGLAPDQAKAHTKKGEQEQERNRYQAGELIVVNQFSSTFQLSYANTGDDKKSRDQHLQDIDRASLPNVSAAQRTMADKQRELREEYIEQKQDAWRNKVNESRSPVKPPVHQSWPSFEKAAKNATSDGRVEDLKGPVAQLWSAWCQQDDEKSRAAWMKGQQFSVAAKSKEEFAAALDERGLSFAAVSKDEAFKSHKQSAFAREIGRYAPRYKEGEIILITEPRLEHRREGEITEPNRALKIDQTLAEKFVKHLDISDKLQSIEVALQSSDVRAQKRSTDRETARLEKATSKEVLSTRIENALVDVTAPRDLLSAIGKVRVPLNALGKAGSGVGSGINAIADGIASLFTPTLTPEQKRDADKATSRRAAEGEHTIDYSRFTSEQAQMRQQLENEQEASRQRERGGGRDR